MIAKENIKNKQKNKDSRNYGKGRKNQKTWLVFQIFYIFCHVIEMKFENILMTNCRN